jgi:hypothetical protein
LVVGHRRAAADGVEYKHRIGATAIITRRAFHGGAVVRRQRLALRSRGEVCAAKALSSELYGLVLVRQKGAESGAFHLGFDVDGPGGIAALRLDVIREAANLRRHVAGNLGHSGGRGKGNGQERNG